MNECEQRGLAIAALYKLVSVDASHRFAAGKKGRLAGPAE